MPHQVPKSVRVAVALICLLSLSSVPAEASFTSTPTDWDNFFGANGYVIPYTYKGAPVVDHEKAQDPTNGGTGVQPDGVDLASGSPSGAPGPYDTPFYGYYNGGTLYDPNDPSTLEDDYIMFRMRIGGDPSQKAGFDSYHWNVLLDVDRDGYKEYWVDLNGAYSQSSTVCDQLQILYGNDGTQLIADPDAARVEEFYACNSPGGFSHTRVTPLADGTGDFWLDIQVPMTSFNDLSGNQVLFPNSPVGFVFSTGASNNDPLQKDLMTDIGYLSSNDPVSFGDIVKSNGEPDLLFTDSALNTAGFYNIGDAIFTYLRDPFANTDSATVQSIAITVTNPTSGDDEVLTLYESGPASGIFTNLGGATKPSSSSPLNGWVPYVMTSSATQPEDWTLTYDAASESWTVCGSLSGCEPSRAVAETPYASAGGEVYFTLYESSPANGATVTFTTYAADPLTSSSSPGSDNDGDLQVFGANTIFFSYTSRSLDTFTASVPVVGPGVPFIQFTRSTGLPSGSFFITTDPASSEPLYVTVYHAESNTDPLTTQTITVSLAGRLDSQSLTLTETGPDTGVFRNTAGLRTKIYDGVAAPDVWEDVDGGEVTATFTYAGTPYSTVASLFYAAGAGRVNFTNAAGTLDVTAYASGQPVFVKVTDSSVCAGSLTVTISSQSGDSETIALAETSSGSGIYMNRINDLVTTAGSAVVTSATSNFLAENVHQGGVFVIASGPDAGNYTVAGIISSTELVLSSTLAASRTGIGFSAAPLLTANYTGSHTVNDKVLAAADGDSLSVTYTDCADGDSDSSNNDKSDGASYNAPSVVINEVLFYPDSGSCQREYIGIYNASSQDIDVTGYRVTDGDSLNYTVPQYEGADIILRPGKNLYISIYDTHPSERHDPLTDTYYVFAYAEPSATPPDELGDPSASSASDRADQISLYNSSGVIVDYVAWSSTASPSVDFLGDDGAAVSSDIWQDDAFVNISGIERGDAIARVTSGIDTNSPADWTYAATTSVCDYLITKAVVASFSAYVSGGDVVVSWETASEIDTAGFYLYRKDETGSYKTVLDMMVPALPDSPQGGSYRVIDETASAGGRYSYLVVEIENTGGSIQHGPFTVYAGSAGETDEKEAPGVSAAALNASSMFEREGRGSSSFRKTAPIGKTATASSAARNGGNKDRAKLFITEDGLYLLDAAAISKILAIPYESVKAKIRNSGIALFNEGRKVAYTPYNSDQGILFYGEKISSVYTDENVYWLVREDGLTMEVEEGAAPDAHGAEGVFSETKRFEENNFSATALFSDPHGDYWFWDYVVPGYAGMDERSFTLSAEGVGSSGSSSLTVYLQGATNTTAAADHHAVFSLNGTRIGETKWDGTGAHSAKMSFSQGILRSGPNVLAVRGELGAGVPYSIFYVNAFDLSYSREYAATGDKLIFTAGESGAVEVSGFSAADILLLDVTSPAAPRVCKATRIEKGEEGYSISFKAVAERRYLAVAAGALSPVAKTQTSTPSSLSSQGSGADYVIITAAPLMEAAGELAGYRRAAGLNALVIDLEDIMNEFSHGIFNPEAIRSFLAFTYGNWKPSPRYVLLAGDGTYDYKNHLGHGGNIIPPVMVETPYGLFPSDNYLGDINDDYVPEIAVGRLPAVSSSELADIIAKIRSYESAAGDWKERAVLLADKAVEDGDFSALSDKLALVFPAGYDVDRIYLSDNTPEQARRLIMDAVNGGTGFLNYMGHGGLDRMSSYGMVVSGDVSGFTNNGKPPLVTAMTCVVGNFATPGYDSLAEVLLLPKDRGAIAVWAPTGMSFNSEAGMLGEAFYREVFGGGEALLGDIIGAAISAYRAGGGEPSMLDVYTLIGDPALRVHAR